MITEGVRNTLTVEEAAVLLGIGRSLAYDLARRGELPGAVRLGPKRIVVSRAALEKLLAGGAAQGPEWVAQAQATKGGHHDVGAN